MSEILTPLDLRYMGGKKWLLLAEFRYKSDLVGLITVPAGTVTDFNSIPWGLRNTFPPAQYGEAGLVHDHLYDFGPERYEEVIDAENQRLICDQVHREVLEVTKAPEWKRRAMYRTLRLCGWWAWRKHRQADQPEAL